MSSPRYNKIIKTFEDSVRAAFDSSRRGKAIQAARDARDAALDEIAAEQGTTREVVMLLRGRAPAGVTPSK